jgi:hypothetical protein
MTLKGTAGKLLLVAMFTTVEKFRTFCDQVEHGKDTVIRNAAEYIRLWNSTTHGNFGIFWNSCLNLLFNLQFDNG